MTALCLPGERKSVEPMAARVDPNRVRERCPSMHHFVANAPTDDAAVLRVAREAVHDAMERHGPGSLDRRRHRHPEERLPLGWRCAAILRCAGQAGHVSASRSRRR